MPNYCHLCRHERPQRLACSYGYTKEQRAQMPSCGFFQYPEPEPADMEHPPRKKRPKVSQPLLDKSDKT